MEGLNNKIGVLKHRVDNHLQCAPVFRRESAGADND
jgi:hypothetical protein